MLRARYWILTAATLLALTGCGGGSGGSSAVGPTGSVAVRAVWEIPAQGGGATFEGSTSIPGSVKTVEVLLQAGAQTFRELIDPSESRRAVIAGVPPGPATVRINGYDVQLLGVPDLTVTAVAPSYASQAVEIDVVGGETTSPGPIDVFAEPFVTDFAPAPDAVGIPPENAIALLVATATDGIDLNTLDVSVDGEPVVAGGVPQGEASIEACSDGGDAPCGEGDRGIRGFYVTVPGPQPALSSLSVHVQTSDLSVPPRDLDYEYFFDTGGGAS